MRVLKEQVAGELPAINPSQEALLLDIDGTLLDIVARHDAVFVPGTLRADLAQLKNCFGGALALVSGRSLAVIDRLFAPLRLSAIGCHGAEMRIDPELGQIEKRAPPLSSDLRERLRKLSKAFAGVEFEDKIYSVALHYRAAPELGDAITVLARDVCAGETDPPLGLLHGKCVVEIKPVGIGKGHAVRELLAVPPFLQRRPVFLGDDVTDKAVFAMLPEFHGTGISVGKRMEGAGYMFEDPNTVRAWLRNLSRLPVCRR